jgi:hypothetical protein
LTRRWGKRIEIEKERGEVPEIPCELICDDALVYASIRERFNLLGGVKPDIKDGFGKRLKEARGFLAKITQKQVGHHVDLIGEFPVTLCFDMGAVTEADAVSVAGFAHPSVNYSPAVYELYFSDVPKELFSAENRAARYDSGGKSAPMQLFRFQEPRRGRYFGLKFLKANPTDDILRLASVCVSSTQATVRNAYLKRFGPNLLSDQREASPKNSLPPFCGGGVIPEHGTVLENGVLRLSYRLDGSRKLDRVLVIFKDWEPAEGEGQNLRLFLSDDRESLFDRENLREQPGFRRIEPFLSGWSFLSFDLTDGLNQNAKMNRLGVEIFTAKNARTPELCHVGAYSRDVLMKPAQKEVCADFAGIGTNVLPMAMMEESLRSGYSEAHWETEKKRVLMMRPRVIRLWFQIDWMTDGKNRFVFDGPKMRAVYRYLELYAEADASVQLNFGWKNGSGCHDWFAIPGAESPANSAPADLDHFAVACSALLEELILQRGYRNIRLLSFYNEPNGRDFMTAGEDEKAYYLALLKTVDERLRRDGRRGLVEMVGPEEVFAYDWFAYIAEHACPYLDGYSFHVYNALCDEIEEWVAPRLKAAKGKPVYITEFGWSERKLKWESNNAGYLIEAANRGISGILHWMLSAIVPTDPLNFIVDEDMLMFGLLQKEGGLEAINRSYFDVAPLCRYIEPHSRVYPVSCEGETLRAAMFVTQSGDVTIAVEADACAQSRRLRVDLGEATARAFGCHVTGQEIPKDANALLPGRVKTLFCDRWLEDEIDDTPQTLIYTTLAAQKQIAVYPGSYSVRAGERVSLTAKTVDFNDDVEWEVCEPCCGTIDSQGVFTAAAAGITAVKAKAKSDAQVYGVAVLTVTDTNPK